VGRKPELGQQRVESAAALRAVVERSAKPRRRLRERWRAARAMRIIVIEKEKLGPNAELKGGAGVARQALPLLRLASGDDLGPVAEGIDATRLPMQRLGRVTDPRGVDAEDLEAATVGASVASDRTRRSLPRAADSSGGRCASSSRLEQRRGDGCIAQTVGTLAQDPGAAAVGGEAAD
jgi:hypothetical protein